MIARTRSFVRKTGFMRWLARPITSSYARMWDLEGISLAHARRMMGAHSANDEDFEAAGQAHAAEICKLLPSGGRVLDLGCGVGRIARYVAPSCQELLAVDVSPRMLQHARRRLSDLPNVSFGRVNGTDLSGLEDASLDFCYCIQVFHQIEREHTMRYMVELSRVIRPGGGVYLQFLDFEDAANARDFRDYAVESKVLRISRRRYFTVSEVRVLAELAGLTQTEVTRDGDSLILSGRVGSPA